MKITVLNTGGTFNKVYNPIKGELEVPKDNIALDEIISNCFNIDFEIKNVISTYCEFIEQEVTFKEDLHRLVLEAGLNCTIQEFSQIMDKLFQGQLTSGRKRRSKDKNPQNYYCGIKIINSEAGKKLSL